LNNAETGAKETKRGGLIGNKTEMADEILHVLVYTNFSHIGAVFLSLYFQLF
jgi:hypothetical protein